MHNVWSSLATKASQSSSPKLTELALQGKVAYAMKNAKRYLELHNRTRDVLNQAGYENLNDDNVIEFIKADRKRMKREVSEAHTEQVEQATEEDQAG
jgi:DNA polymerase III delta prime subunit